MWPNARREAPQKSVKSKPLLHFNGEQSSRMRPGAGASPYTRPTPIRAGRGGGGGRAGPTRIGNSKKPRQPPSPPVPPVPLGRPTLLKPEPSLRCDGPLSTTAALVLPVPPPPPRDRRWGCGRGLLRGAIRRLTPDISDVSEVETRAFVLGLVFHLIYCVFISHRDSVTTCQIRYHSHCGIIVALDSSEP